MNPSKNQLIQVRFNNGTFFDAIVEAWSDDKSVLRLPNSDDLVVIQKTLQDVMFIRMINRQPIDKKELLEEFDRLTEKPKDQANIQSIAEIKKQLNDFERNEYFKPATSFENNGMRQITYGLPVSSIKKYPAEKTATKGYGINKGLQGLFGKKH